MPSLSLQQWFATRAVALDEIEGAHQSIGGPGPGRRYATQQINQAYAVLLAGQFQRFCRDLHSETVDHLTAIIPHPVIADLFRSRMTEGRKLDRMNANASNIGSDFGRFRLHFWDVVRRIDARNVQRQVRLDELNRWRNAIAHQDFDPAQLGVRTMIRLSDVRRWRAACEALARDFDETVRLHLATILSVSPW